MIGTSNEYDDDRDTLADPENCGDDEEVGSTSPISCHSCSEFTGDEETREMSSKVSGILDTKEEVVRREGGAGSEV